MNEAGIIGDKVHSRLQRHRFVVMIAVIIFIALFLVSVALALYVSSGAAQLDLSRPGYVSVREKASQSSSFDSFPATGAIDKSVLEQFRKQYETQADKAIKVDSFGGDVMSDQTLSLDSPNEQTAQ